MKKWPPTPQRSQRAPSGGRKTIVRAGGHILPDRDISYPAIYVAVAANVYGGLVYAKCQIKLKRKLYRYLVWKHEGVQHSFYLGRVKILTPLTSAGAGARGARRPEGSKLFSGAKKCTEIVSRRKRLWIVPSSVDRS